MEEDIGEEIEAEKAAEKAAGRVAEKAAKKAIKKLSPGSRKRKACAEPIVSQYGPRKSFLQVELEGNESARNRLRDK